MYVSHGSPEVAQIVQALSLAKAASLERLRDCWFDCLLVCTAIVGVGLVLEGPEIFHETGIIPRRKSVELKYWLTPSIDRREKPDHVPLWKKVFAAVGWVFIVLGVMGEGVSEAFVHKYDTALSNLNSAIIEAEQLARVKLEATVAWRRLSPKQQTIMSDNLKPFAGPRVGVSYLNGEAEGLGFSNDIAEALRAAKWNIFSPREPFTQFGGFGGGIIQLESLTGVNVSVTGNRSGRDAADAIQHELCSLGFDTTITRKPQAFGPFDPKIDVEVLIVGRPPTQQGLTQLSIDTSTAMKTCRGSQ